MAMTTAYKNAIANAGGALITHIGLVNNVGTEISGGSYARKPVTWLTASNGTIRPNADITFDVPAVTVGGWRGYTALTAGTDMGGQTLTNEVFASAGQYKLIASGTGILHTDGV